MKSLKVLAVVSLFLLAALFTSGAEWVRPAGNVTITSILELLPSPNSTFASNASSANAVNCQSIFQGNGTDTDFCNDDGGGSFLLKTGDNATGNYSWTGNFTIVEPASLNSSKIHVNSSGCIIITGGQFGGTLEVC